MIDKVSSTKTESSSTLKSSRFTDSVSIKKGLSLFSKIIPRKDAPASSDKTKTLTSSVIITDKTQKQWILPIGLKYTESPPTPQGEVNRTYCWDGGSATVNAQGHLLEYEAKKNKPTPFKEAITVTDGVGKKWFIPKDRIIHNQTKVGLNDQGLITNYTALKKMKRPNEQSIQSGTDYTLNLKGKIKIVDKQSFKATTPNPKNLEPFLHQSECHLSFENKKTGEKLFIPAGTPYKKYSTRFGKSVLEHNGKTILYSPPASEKANSRLPSVPKLQIKEETFVASEERLLITGDNSFYIPKGMSYTKYENGSIMCQNKTGLFPDKIDTANDRKISDTPLNNLKASLDKVLSTHKEGDIITIQQQHNFVKQLDEYTRRTLEHNEESLGATTTRLESSIELLRDVGLTKEVDYFTKKIDSAKAETTSRLVLSCPDIITGGQIKLQKPYLEMALSGMVMSASITPDQDKKISEMSISLAKSISKSTPEEQQNTISALDSFLSDAYKKLELDKEHPPHLLKNIALVKGIHNELAERGIIKPFDIKDLMPQTSEPSAIKNKRDSGVSFGSQQSNSAPSLSATTVSSFTPTLSTTDYSRKDSIDTTRTSIYTIDKKD